MVGLPSVSKAMAPRRALRRMMILMSCLHGLRRHGRRHCSCAQRQTCAMKDEALASADVTAHAPSPIDAVGGWAPSMFCSAEQRPTFASGDLPAIVYVQAACDVGSCP